MNKKWTKENIWYNINIGKMLLIEWNENVNILNLNYILTVYLTGMVIFLTINYIFISKQYLEKYVIPINFPLCIIHIFRLVINSDELTEDGGFELLKSR